MTVAEARASRLVEPGRNCWCVERADRFSAIQDGEYFRLAREALLKARHTVFILGWDITGGIDLLPGAPPPEQPRHLDKLIGYIARKYRRLQCYILIWDYALLYTMERDPLSRWRFGWRMPRNVRFGFDDHHPVGASHHQKVVVIDDRLAFCGGMDLTGHRWDTSAHRPVEPARTTPLGEAYGPYHEVQAMVEGPVAARLGALARERWRALGAERLPAVDPRPESLWPDGVTPDFTDVDVAIARTVPGEAARPAVRECEALYLDAIGRATRTIYIENQYFTNQPICDALAARLAEPDGPEVIVVLPKGGDGWLERNTIELFRDRLFRCLIDADAHQRLRLVFPMASRADAVPTFVHSKVMIVDDALVRIGSANANHRSMGVDTECDLVVDAAGNPDVCAGIRGIRDRLLAEHLGLPVEAVSPALEAAGSLRGLIDARRDGDHTLVPFDPPPAEVSAPSDAVRAAVDPDEPIGFGPTVNRLVPPVDASIGRVPLRVWVVPSSVVAGGIVIAWLTSESFRESRLMAVQEAIETVRQTPSAAWIGAGVFLVGAFAMIPLEALVIGAGIVFGPVRGGVVALTGSLAAAVLGYVAGQAIGPTMISRWMSRRSYRAGRQLVAHGISGVAVLRLTSIASAGAIHLLSGAARVPLSSYVGGTLIGLAPAIVALSGFGAVLGKTVLRPTVSNAVVAGVAGAALVALAFGVRTFLLVRQFAPSLSRHRERAEFG